MVAGEVLQHTRGDKVIASRSRRKNSRVSAVSATSFRIRITEIRTGGAKASKTAPPRPKREAKPKVEGAPEGETKAKKPAAKPARKKPAAKKPAAKGKKK